MLDLALENVIEISQIMIADKLNNTRGSWLLNIVSHRNMNIVWLEPCCEDGFVPLRSQLVGLEQKRRRG